MTYVKIPWNSKGGGVLAVMKAFEFKRLEADIPLIKGHAGPVVDFEFSPFNDSLLSTASQDGTVKLWQIPEGGITKDVTKADGELNHGAKVIFGKFHPSADMVIATAAIDTSVKIWDVSKQQCTFTFDGLKTQSNDLAWSPNGSLLATTTKDKLVSVFDPRQGNGSLQSSKAHEGARQQKLTWLGDSERIFTCGFEINERQYAVWDVRNFAAPVIKRRLDEYGSVPFLVFDEEHKIVFVSGKGESSTTMF